MYFGGGLKKKTVENKYSSTVIMHLCLISFFMTLQGYQVSVRSVVTAATYSTCWSGSTAIMNVPLDVAVTAA